MEHVTMVLIDTQRGHSPVAFIPFLPGDSLLSRYWNSRLHSIEGLAHLFHMEDQGGGKNMWEEWPVVKIPAVH